jgi:uncharacterized protein (DUF1800 family)
MALSGPLNAAPYTIPAVAPQAGVAKQEAQAPLDYDRNRLIAGHVLRRIGFGPNPAEMAAILQMGPQAYINQQLNPTSIDDSAAERRLPPKPHDQYDYDTYMKRWFLRMTYSRRQLREKMTLIWHEHFATGLDKVSVGCLMAQQEELLRKDALGNFRDLLIGITKDKAMLAYLDNNYNNGQAYDDKGKLIPPNENYAREFLQLFSMGPAKLRMDGTVVTNSKGVPVAGYTERDVREIARAFTGWYHDYKCLVPARFYEYYHDPNDKKVLGTTIAGRAGNDGAREVEAVVDVVMRNPNVAPFISKMLIQKLATETPSAGYVQRVSTVFANSGGNIRAVVSAILNDSEFYSDAVILSQYKEPVEQFVGALRALEANTKGGDLIGWFYVSGQLPYFPPSVFSFYPPGQKETLINAALLINRDRVADGIVYNAYETSIDPAALIRKHNLKTPAQVVDYLSNALIVGPLQSDVRNKIIAYMKGHVNDEKFRGAAWLILCSPDFQRN